ncbi:MAG: type II secretion system F family protein [Planctomycetes bacterium]|nr:type II secretion system F family protein [Planctomycetota bacterium]
MPVFAYEAVDAKGKPAKGEIEARTKEEAADKVRNDGFYVTKVEPKSAGGSMRVATGEAKRKKTLAFGGVSAKQLTQFTRQFATLIDAGLPVVRSLDILQNQFQPGSLQNAIMDVKDDVQGGSALSEAMAKHPKIWDTLYTSMVKAGEAGGVLETIFTRLSEFMEKSQKLKRQIVSALVYPAAVLTIAGVIVLFIITVVIPKFKVMFEDFNTSLPLPTLILIGVTDVVRHNIWMPPVAIFGLWLIMKLITASPKGRYVIDSMKLRFPVFGTLLRKTAISRFARTLGTLIAAGVPILDALNIIRGTVGNAVVSTAVGDVQTAIREGDSIAEPLRHSGVFDDMVVNMVDVGEETGELDKMLMKVADTYDNEVDTMVAGLMGLLEPLIIVFMGLVVGGIVIALFMPLIEIMKTMGGAAGG